MNYKEFIGEIQHRIESGTFEEAVRTTRAVLETLGERLTEGEATDVASPLPMEIDRYLLQVENEQRYDRDEFIDRVKEKMDYRDMLLLNRYSTPGEVERPEVVYRIKAVLDLLAEEMPGGEIQDLQDQLPEEFDDFFEFLEVEDLPWEQNE
jgi:uncharacterized protein (DUF2267 family)